MLLSVRLMTYNHSKSIIKCLEGIERQQTTFPFEVVIGDDFSSDNNIELIQQFISLSKNSKIKYNLLQRKKGDLYDTARQKKGRLYNFTNIIENSKGKYIALLDGDDCWLDPFKLQKQVDVLEKNSNVSLVYTNAKISSDKGGDYEGEATFYKSDYPLMPLKKQDFFLKNNYALLVVTVMFRKSDFDENVKNTMLEFATGDFALYFMLSGKGDFYYINECSSLYYDHAQGESKRFSKLKRDKHNYNKMHYLKPYIKPSNLKLFTQYQHLYLIRSIFNIMFRKVKLDGLNGLKYLHIFFVKPNHLKLRYIYYYIKLVFLKSTFVK
jgi:glycosyltransferase involved in cell wall biosynthesis